jgi:hypothetical protein
MIMTITPKLTDSQDRELSLTELDNVNGGNLSTTQKAVLVTIAAAVVAGGPAAGPFLLGCFGLGLALF